MRRWLLRRRVLDREDWELVGRAVIITLASAWLAGTLGLAWRIFALAAG